MAELNDDKTIHLLGIASSDLPDPEDGLLAWLRLAGGATSIEAALARIAEPAGLPPRSLLDGGVALDLLRRVKSRCVALARDNQNSRDRLDALLVHRLVVASALLHHRTLISQRSREHWDRRWIDLAAEVPEPWKTFLRKAADAE